MKQVVVRFLIVLLIVSAAVIIFMTMAGCAGVSTQVRDSEPLDDHDGTAALADFISAEMSARDITGLSVAVASSEGLLWTQGFGSASTENGTPFTDQTISNVGSVSKLLTATAVMRLVETGAVDLDAPVSAYIPEFDPAGQETPITVRMLLNHESGLESDAFRDFYLGFEPPEDSSHSYRRAIDAVNQSGVVRQPYEIFSYCNLGFSLLGVIVERAQGGNFEEAVKELVFDPLRMGDSTFNIDEVPDGELATGYVGRRSQSVPYLRDMPAGTLNTTAQDMGLFLQSMLASYRTGGGLLSTETTREMFTPSNNGVAADLDFQVGLTWWIINFRKLPGEFIVGHGGDLPPYHSLAILLPERDLSVFIMVNSVSGMGSFSLADILAETVRTFAESEGQDPIPAAVEPSPVVEIPANIMADLPGYYASTAGLSEVKVSGDRLKMYAFNRWFDVDFHEDNTLTLGYRILGIIPLNMPIFDDVSVSLEEIGGARALNLRAQGILIAPAVRIEPVPVDPSWLERCGRYEAAGSEVMPLYTDFRIEMDRRSGFLCLHTKAEGEWSKFPLETIDGSSARIMGTGRSLGGMIRTESGDSGEVIRYLNFELHRVR